MTRADLHVQREDSRAGEKRCFLRIAAAGALLLTILYLFLAIFLATPFAAGLLSEYLTRMTGQTVTVSSISLNGLGLGFHGVTIQNPPGFPSGPMASARILRIAPDLRRLLVGRKALSRLQTDGLRVNFRKNDQGKWNYQPLMQSIQKRKTRPSAETFVRHLYVNDAAVNINNVIIGPLSLHIDNFSTKGSTPSRSVFTGTDRKGNPFTIVADGRLGTAPDISVKIVAPSFSLADLSSAPNAHLLDLRDAFARDVAIEGSYRSGDVTAKGHFAFDGGMWFKRQETRLHGVLSFEGGYSGKEDKGTVRRVALSLNDAVKVDGTGTISHVRAGREFDIRVNCNRMRLQDLAAPLPKEALKGVTLRGYVTCTDVHFAGNGREGITTGGGIVFIKDGEAIKEGKQLVQGLTAGMVIARTTVGWGLRGNFHGNATAGKISLRNSTGRITAIMSKAFRPVAARVEGTVLEIPVQGELKYLPDRYAVAVNVKKAPAAALNRLINGKALPFTGGAFDVSIRATGTGPASFQGEATGRVSEITGTVSGKRFNTGMGSYTSRFRKSGKTIAAAGEIGFHGGSYSGKPVSCSLAYSVAERNVSLSRGSATFGQSRMRFDEIRGRVPVPESSTAGNVFPVNFRFAGVDFTGGGAAMKKMSGTSSAAVNTGAGGRFVAGTGAVDIPSISFRDHPFGSVKARFVLSREGAVVNTEGSVLDGKLAAVVKGDPFKVREGVSFDGTLEGLQAAKLSELFPETFPIRISAGTLKTGFRGKWSGERGAGFTLEASGDGLTLAEKTGRTIIDGADANLLAEASGSRLVIERAVLTRGRDLVVKASGALSDPASRSRTGSFSVTLDSMTVNSAVGAFANLLPKPLQEANAGGTIRGGCDISIGSGKVVMQGNMQVDNGVLEIPSEKLVISGIGGTVPFSIFLTGGKPERPPEGAPFTREDYSSLLKTLEQERNEGVLLKASSIRLGALEATGIKVRMKANEGRVEMTSIECGLYNGILLGKGFYLYDHGSHYGADLLLSDMSLRLFCNSYPKLKGYISGLVDGVISILGEKGGLPALAGFVDLWAHESKTEKMLVSKEFLQRLAGKKLKGFFFRNDRPYDNGEISAYLLDGDVTFEALDISHTNFFGMKDLNVSVAPVQNRIALDHLLQSIREAAARGKPAAGEPPPEPPAQPDTKWLE